MKATQKRGGDGWGNVQPIYKISRIVSRFRLFKLVNFLLPEELIHGFGMWFGERIIKRSGAKHRVIDSLKLLYGDNLPKTRFEKTFKHIARYIGLFVFDTIFLFPNLTMNKLKKKIEFENLHYWEEARDFGKGVIVISVHLSQFFRALIAVPLVDPSRKTYVIANIRHMDLYRYPMKRNKINLIPTPSYHDAKADMERVIRDGNILIIAWDMGRQMRNLKVKFLDYLLPTPGSVVSLALDTGAMILPVVMLPNKKGGYTKHRVRLLKPFTVERRESKKSTFGEYNTKINSVYAPYLKAYPFLWFEIIGFAASRTRYVFKFPNQINKMQFIALATNYLKWFLDTSWEKNRDDVALEALTYDLVKLVEEGGLKYPYHFTPNAEIKEFEIELNRTSLVNISIQLVNAMMQYPNIETQLIGDDSNYFKPESLAAERENLLNDKLKAIKEKFAFLN